MITQETKQLTRIGFYWLKMTNTIVALLVCKFRCRRSTETKKKQIKKSLLKINFFFSNFHNFLFDCRFVVRLSVLFSPPLLLLLLLFTYMSFPGRRNRYVFLLIWKIQDDCFSTSNKISSCWWNPKWLFIITYDVSYLHLDIKYILYFFPFFLILFLCVRVKTIAL